MGGRRTMTQDSRARVILRSRPARILAGHPWVYQNEVAAVEGDFRPGDIVEVVDNRRRFLGRGYLNPASQILVRLLTADRDEIVDENLFRRRLQRAWDWRRRFLPDTSSCRVVFGEADFLPALIVDKYKDYLVLQTLALGIEIWKETIVRLLVEIIQPKGIYERNDVPVRELEGLGQRTGPLWGQPEPTTVISENGFRIEVDMENGHKTGYFLDQRENRAAIRPLVSGARVLDAFCHSGSFAIHAAGFGAASVLGIDISPQAILTARRNAELNNLSVVCDFREGNVFDELRRFDSEGATFDVVILDPPAFAKNRAALEGAVRGYKEINLRAMKILAPGGFLVTCSCSQHLGPDLFWALVADAAADARRRLRLVESRFQARDHPVLIGAGETLYLKCLIVEVF